MTARRGIALQAGAAFSFAIFVAMYLSLAGRIDAAGLTLCMVLGSLTGACVIAGRPVDAFRSMSRDARMAAALGGALAFFAPPAIVGAVRFSDAPQGSVVVFWVSGGWALAAALTASWMAWRAGSRTQSAVVVSGGLVAFAGAAAVVANWERPSSFSPLIRFPVQELAMFLAAFVLVAGVLLLVSASRTSGLGGSLVAGGLSALACAALWLLLSDPVSAFRSVSELPVQIAIAAVAWGGASVLLSMLVDSRGLASSAATFAVAPVLLTALTWAEQLAGMAGPQPLIIPGVIAGSLIVATAAIALSTARSSTPEPRRPRWLTWVACIPLAASLIALALPAVTATADVNSPPSAVFNGSWTMLGIESLAAWSAVALCALLVATALTGRQRLLPLVATAACLAWFMLLDVPTHVLNDWLSSAVQSYYGTEYGTISFTAVTNAPMLFAVGSSAVGFVALFLLNTLRRTPAGSPSDL